MRRQSITALAMLIGGGMLALITLVWISARITSTIGLADTTGGVAGIVLAGLGYRRVAAPEPSPAAIQYPVRPAAHLRQIEFGR